MTNRTAILISSVLHGMAFLYLLSTPRIHYAMPAPYVAVTLNPPEIQPKPEPPKEEEKPKIKKVSEDLIRDLQDKLANTPTPRPSRKPTLTPSPKRTATPKPTARPTSRPSPTTTPMPATTPMPTVPANLVPLSEIAKLLTPQPFSPNVKSASGLYQVNISGMGSKEAETYAIMLNNHLKRFWKVPMVRPPHEGEWASVVMFTIDRQGVISDFKIIVPSGWGLMDRTVQEAVEKANPVPPLPPTYPQSSAQVSAPFVLQPNIRKP